VIRIRRALLSVSDKRGLIIFARTLHRMGVELISTGGTHAALVKANIPARQVSEITGFPEILDGRVKTLHPVIHGGLLGVNDNPQHQEQMAAHGITPIDMVVVNLYPFSQTVEREGVTLEEAVEQIDIGGPAMLRSAAKNHRHRAVIVDPDRYGTVLEEMTSQHGCLTEETCFALACEVFRHTAAYDVAIAEFLTGKNPEAGFPPTLQIIARKELDLRYGENPHQAAALYGGFLRHFEKLHGKELSYNNIVDMSAAAALVLEFSEPAAVIVKHSNPCGVATGASISEAYGRALVTDSVSAFGGVVAVNRPLDTETAERINQIFTEAVIAPDISGSVLEVLQKKKDRRLVRMAPTLREALSAPGLRSVPGGYLLQEPDLTPASEEELRVVTRRTPTQEELRGLRFAWRVAKYVKSNAIVFASADRTLGIGAGQTSRVDSSRFAVTKATQAGLSLKGSAVASDAYFPFADGLVEAVRAGASAVIQPGGSVRDGEVIAAADEHGLAMVFTGTRHFRH
jgi:phosphoribosylaminoimidazolecarboxamide formyltransferase/IMP cyclohydrolase